MHSAGLRVLLLSLLATGLFGAGCVHPRNWGYIAHLAYSQLRLSASRRPIGKFLSAPENLSQEQVSKLLLIQSVREYCKEITLNADKVYDSYAPVEDIHVYLLAASERLAFRPYLWKWPFVGRLPYKAFFSKEAALEERERLREQGYDTHISKALGYSTLGWFHDPALPGMLEMEDVALIQLVIHESTHRTIYSKGNASFNEGAATAISLLGTEEFTLQHFGPSSTEHRASKDLEHDLLLLAGALDLLYKRLDQLYRSNQPDEAKWKERQRIFKNFHSEWVRVKTQMKTPMRAALPWAEMNNAWVLILRTYLEHLQTYLSVYGSMGGDLRRTVQFFRAASQHSVDPHEAVIRLLEEEAFSLQYSAGRGELRARNPHETSCCNHYKPFGGDDAISYHNEARGS